RRHATSPLQNLRFQQRSAFLNRPTRMTRVQTGNSLFKESLLPQRDESRSAVQLFLDLLIGFSFSQHQNQSGSSEISRWKRTRPSTKEKLFFFRGSQLNGFIGHASLYNICTSEVKDTVH